MSEQPRLRYELYVRATPEQLWEALVNPNKTAGYYYGSVVESEWRPESPIVYKAGGETMIDGAIMAVERPTKLVHSARFTYGPELAADHPSRVSWDIEPMGEVCKLTLTQEHFEGETATYRDSLEGWPVILSGLKTLVETGEPSPCQQGTDRASVCAWGLHTDAQSPP